MKAPFARVRGVEGQLDAGGPAHFEAATHGGAKGVSVGQRGLLGRAELLCDEVEQVESAPELVKLGDVLHFEHLDNLGSGEREYARAGAQEQVAAKDFAVGCAALEDGGGRGHRGEASDVAKEGGAAEGVSLAWTAVRSALRRGPSVPGARATRACICARRRSHASRKALTKRFSGVSTVSREPASATRTGRNLPPPALPAMPAMPRPSGARWKGQRPATTSSRVRAEMAEASSMGTSRSSRMRRR